MKIEVSTDNLSEFVGFWEGESLKKQSEVTENTKKAFIDAFCIINRQKPIEKITINEISKKAGYNRCTFYQYFKDIYDLRDKVEDIAVNQIKYNFQNRINHDNFSQTFIEAVIKTQTEQAKIYDILLNSDNIGHFTEKIKMEIAATFMEKFKLPADDIKSDYIFEMYFSTVISAVSCWIKNDRDLPIEDFSHFIRKVLTKGIIYKN